MDFSQVPAGKGRAAAKKKTGVIASPPPLKAVTKADPFDIERAKKDFEPYRKEIDRMCKEALDLEVKDDATNQTAATMMGQARALSKNITEIKDKALRPHNDFRTKLIAFAKVFTSPLEGAVADLNKKVKDFAYAQILAQREREKKEREATERRQRELDAQAKAAGVESVTLPATPVDEKTKIQTRTESGSSVSITLVWTGTIVDPVKVPREYCTPDQRKIDDAVKAGVREIPGVEIKEEPKSRLRA